jgi:hypothetical protein
MTFTRSLAQTSATVALTLLTAALNVPAQVITTVAGTSFIFPTQAVQATSTPLGQVSSVALDSNGNIYVADPTNQIVVRVAPSGLLTVVARERVRWILRRWWPRHERVPE